MIKKYLIVILFIVCFFVPVSFFGQQLTLKQCVRMALEKNKNISIAEKQEQKADLMVRVAGTNYLPKFSANGMGLYGNNDMDFALNITGLPKPIGLKFDADNIYEAGVGVRQPLYMGGKVNSAYKMATIGRDISRLNKKLTADQVTVEVYKAYWNAVKASEMQKSAEQYRKTVVEFFRNMNNAFNAGMKPRNDLMKVQVRLNDANLKLQRAKDAVRLSRMYLCNVIGLPLRSNIDLSDSFESGDFLMDRNVGITARPEYLMLNKQVDIKKYEKRYVASDFLPQVGIAGSYNYMHGIKFNNAGYLLNGTNYEVLLSVKIPIFNWGEGAKKVKAAERDMDISRLSRDDAYDKMTLELQNRIDGYDEALLEVKMTRHALKQSEENLRMSRNNYDVGMETLSDYLQAQSIWQNAKAEYISARTNLEISKVEYLKAAGKL